MTNDGNTDTCNNNDGIMLLSDGPGVFSVTVNATDIMCTVSIIYSVHLIFMLCTFRVNMLQAAIDLVL